MSVLTRFSLILALTIAASTPAEALSCRELLLPLFERAARHFKGQEFAWIDANGKAVRLVTGDPLGNGMSGAVLKLENFTGDLPEGYPRDALVVKVPLAFRLPGIGTFAFPHSKVFQRGEARLESRLREQVAKVESSEFFPKDPAWEKGVLPAPPILSVLDTPYGKWIVKPVIRGTSLTRLVDKSGVAGLTPEMKRSLHELYDLTQALFDQATAFGKSALSTGGTRVHAFKLDLNPSNLVWVTEPDQMRMYGLKRPSFMLFELGEHPSDPYLRENMNFQEFLSFVDQWVQREAAAGY